MEDLGKRFPLISQIILNNVDNKSLTIFRTASRENSNFLDRERFYWIRNIKKYFANFQEFQEAWKKVVNKTSVEFLEDLAINVHSFFNGVSKRCEQQWHPLFIGAACGTVNLCNHIIQKTGVKEPWLKSGRTPLHLAAMNGNLEVVRSFMANDFVNSERQKTVLYGAVFGGNLDMCKLLIEEYKNTLDNNGKTPLDLAFSERNWEITRFQKISMEKIGTTFRFVHVGLKP